MGNFSSKMELINNFLYENEIMKNLSKEDETISYLKYVIAMLDYYNFLDDDWVRNYSVMVKKKLNDRRAFMEFRYLLAMILNYYQGDINYY